MYINSKIRFYNTYTHIDMYTMYVHIMLHTVDGFSK